MRNAKWLAWVSVGVLACGDSGGGAKSGEDKDPSQEIDGSTSAGDAGADAKPGDAKATSGDGSTNPGACVTVSTGVELQPVHLSFAFDVSGSMGNGDELWYDRKLKWDPVVRATKAFFASDNAKGLTASMTFFPGANKQQICSDSSYTKPDVKFTALPSSAFATAIDAITPKNNDDWRSGTPTLAVMQGTAEFVTDTREREPGRYAIVLVTDGYPQSCSSNANKISTVIAEAKASFEHDLPTYVIGVANPPVKGAPDTVSNLNGIAAAGGTTKAVLIDTGNPDATVTAFTAAIEQIRKATISCELAIPSEAQAGRAFDKQSVVVHYDGTNGSTQLTYDKACTGSNGWHYDNVDNPTSIELCNKTCDTVRADPAAKLAVEFACEQVIFL